MDERGAPTSQRPDTEPASAPVPTRWMLPRLPLLIGVIGLGAVVTTGLWTKKRDDERVVVEAQAVVAELSTIDVQVAIFRQRLENLKWHAAKLGADAQAATTEPLKTWSRHRAMRFAALVGEIERAADEPAARRFKAEIERLCAEGHVTIARVRLSQMPTVAFPEAEEFRALQQKHYYGPLARFSRQNPGYYRVFHEHEPEAAKTDEAELRRELEALGVGEVTPQTMLGFELLGAVADADDPLVADWTAVTTAEDFFEQPDEATLGRWRRAQRAVRAGEWQEAVAQMQAILKSTVRTRQPFRAAYARAILRNTPEDTAAAYPFMEEAARAGDKRARKWVSEENAARGRFAAALPWLEARARDGEVEAVGALLSIYEMPRETVKRDAEQEFGMLERITNAPDAPPLAWMLLARHYESAEGEQRSLEKAFGCYQRAAEQGHVPAWLEVARWALGGSGTPENLDVARDWAAKAFATGERERSQPMLMEIMRRAPARSAGRLLELFENESVIEKAGFADERIVEQGARPLRLMVARYFDRRGDFGRAAKLYAGAASGTAAAKRHRELTTARACESCGGGGKVQQFTPCPTCEGKATVLCGTCDGRGYHFKPGAPPCPTCGGSGGMVQEGRAVACGVCNGTGKGKSAVVKEPCGRCVGGRIVCRVCTGGQIKVTKACAVCRGSGARALADG